MNKITDARRAYLKEYRRKWMAARRAAWLTGKVCVRCKGSQNLNIDHIDPAQKVSHSVWSWRAERRDAELSKCQVLCHDCHVLKTNDDFGYGPEHVFHGTSTAYRNGCRCFDCTAVQNERVYAWRAARKKSLGTAIISQQCRGISTSTGERCKRMIWNSELCMKHASDLRK